MFVSYKVVIDGRFLSYERLRKSNTDLCARFTTAHDGVIQTRTGSAERLGSAARGLVGEVGREPTLDLFDGLPFAACIARDLIFAKAADGEVPRLRTKEVQAADAGGGRHRRVFGQSHAGVARAYEREKRERFTVIRTRWIAERRTNARFVHRRAVQVRREGFG